ncbi:hypothetical protein HJC23_005574 [Cyclotella cryptica]|uniref:DNA repair protein RecN n=1 Tax=Cyclotella cryptica TaxID=29204 RepID=A0ABD3PQR8_9STRA|eukprot:CCRYP_012479-RB/>CCRYP_012479-RB protein AED:0.16 eAED:0.16 QI:76/1/1/1/0.66/0.5/4/1235/827
MQPVLLSILSLLSKTTTPICRLSHRAFFASPQSSRRRRHLLLAAGTSVNSDGGIPSSYRSSNCHDSSHIVSITSKNIAGMRNEENSDGIVIELASLIDENINGDKANVSFATSSNPGLVAITGESGSGKSILVSKAIDLVTGGKAAVSLFPPTMGLGDSSESCCVEIAVKLVEPHLSAVSSSLSNFGVDPNILYNQQLHSSMENLPTMGRLHLSRTMQRTRDSSGRMKSICKINGRHVSLKTLRYVSSPLFTRVDVSTASAALSRPNSRLAMIDTGVSTTLKRKCLQCRDEYEEARKRRKQIEKELNERVLPIGMQRGGSLGGEEEMEFLKHWVDELDKFEARLNIFREAILGQFNELFAESKSDGSNYNNAGQSTNLIRVLKMCQENTWEKADVSEDASLFAAILELREELKAVETKLASAHSAYEMIASLSAKDSVVVALEKVRKILYSISRDDGGPLFDSLEKTHELLNDAEEKLNDCARAVDGNSDSVVSTLEKMVCTGISPEQIDNIVADWNALSRKHGISPYVLPKCHQSLRQELDGSAEAALLLPVAEEDERSALKKYSEICRDLSDARKKVASDLSESVTKLLPSLGLEGSTFQVEMGLRQGGFENPFCSSESIGVDTVDFVLLHQRPANGDRIKHRSKVECQHGGYVDQVGSSGEKSRVILAIETSLPGSIGTTCNAHSAALENEQINPNMPPCAIIYDEIDAHVGGRAAVTMAKLLADQTRWRSISEDGETLLEGGSQIIAITHSASVAAIADRHIVVERSARSGKELSSIVKAFAVDGSSRRKEIARMASGDLAVGEAKTFADALIRDAMLQRHMS